jgi:hypothetical protein
VGRAGDGREQLLRHVFNLWVINKINAWLV